MVNNKGESVNLMLEPPFRRSLPLLHDENGHALLDHNGKPFILGDGGLSNFTNFSTDDGLALDALHCSYVDHLGQLWFGTWGGGLSRFDGKSFTNFTTGHGLDNNIIFSICEDDSNNLWCSTGSGSICRFDGRSFKRVSIPEDGFSNTVRKILKDGEGNLWFANEGAGLCRYNMRKAHFPCASGTCNHHQDQQDERLAHEHNLAETFSVFSTQQGLSTDAVKSVFQDNDGNFWISTDGKGICRLSSKINSTACGKGECNHALDQAVPLSRHNEIIAGYFNVYGTGSGLCSDHILDATEDRNGNLWFCTMDAGVCRFDVKRKQDPCCEQRCKHNLSIKSDLVEHNATISCYFSHYNQANGLGAPNVRCVMEDRSGNIWFGTDGGGVSRYDNTRKNNPCAQGTCQHQLTNKTERGEHLEKLQHTFETFTTQQGLSNNRVYSMSEDHEGNLWFTSVGGGVSRYNGKSFVNFSNNQGLPHNAVFSMAGDHVGNLWFGTGEGGVCRFDGTSFTTYSTTQGLSDNDVESILETRDGNMWFGTYKGGVNRFDGRSFTWYSLDQGLPHVTVNGIMQDRDGTLWLATGGGVCFFNGQRFVSFTTEQGLADNWVYSVKQDATGNIWFGTGSGLTRLDATAIASVCQAANRNHLETLRTDRRSNNQIIKRALMTFHPSHGLADDEISTVFTDRQGNLWCCTPGGLSVLSAGNLNMINQLTEKEKAALYDPGGKQTHLFHTLTTMDGLPDNYITQIVQTNENTYYVGSNQGFCELLRVSPDSFMVGRIFNTASGYPVKDVNGGQQAMIIDSMGRIWMGTGSDQTALVRFDPSALPALHHLPNLLIQRVKINEENIPWYNLSKLQVDSTTRARQEIMVFGKLLTSGERQRINNTYHDVAFSNISAFYPLPQDLVLPYQDNTISFDYVALETGANSAIRYSYFLEGYSKSWSPETANTSVTFGNMYEGNYRFMVKARNLDGKWSEAITYTFRVLPPWWRTWWAYILYLLGFAAIISYYIRWREHSLKERQHVLESTVAQRTDELVRKNELVEKQKAEVEEQKNVIEREKERSEELLLNILPYEIAEELKQKGSADARQFDSVTVMFTDFKDFTKISEKLSAAELVEEIDICFRAFDQIITRHNLEKIKTIGDSYMCAGGLPNPNPSHATDVVNAALDLQQFMTDRMKQRQQEGKVIFSMRTGIHTGPVVAGIVGVKKFAYDIWGDTVNIASRMESSGEEGKINISEATYNLIKQQFRCTHRGRIQAKNKGEINMYFVEGR